MTKLAAISREIHLVEAPKSRATATAADPATTARDEREVRMFEGAFEIVPAATKLAARESAEVLAEAKDRAEAPADRDAVDVDVITTMLEQLAKEGPRLSRPNLEAELANFERSLRGRSAARA